MIRVGSNAARTFASALVTVLSIVAGAQSAQAAPTLTITPLTWNIVGLDSNNPLTQGPHEFLSGARVCNTGPDAANNVSVDYIWDTANAYVNISPRGVSTESMSLLPSGECQDFYFLIRVTRTPLAFNTTRRYHITASATNASSVSTPTPRELYVEKIISQNRNDVVSVSGPTTVYVGQTVDYVVQSFTATQGYEQLSSFLDFPNLLFRVKEVSATYSAPPGGTNDRVYSDACTWDPVIGLTPPGGTYRSCLSTGKAGGDVQTTYTVQFRSAGTSNVIETIYDFSGSSYHYNADLGLNNVNITTLPPLSNIQFNKHCEPGPATPGSTITCTIEYANTSTSTSYNNVEIEEFYDSRTNYVSASPSPTTGNNLWNIGTLSPGEYGSITVTLTVDNTGVNECDFLLNRAEISDDVARANDSPGDLPGMFNYAEDTQTITLQSANTATLRVTKTGSPDPAVAAGGTLTYTLNYQNLGPATSYNTVLTDVLPTGLTLVSSVPAATTSSAPTYTWNLGNLASGASGSITVTATVSSSLVTATMLTNNATLQGQTGAGTVSSCGLQADVEESQFVLGGSAAQSDLSITKTDSDPVGGVAQGGILTYTMTVQNAGPDVATNVVVTDTLGANKTYASSSLGTACTNTSGTVTCSLGTMAVGASTTFTINVTVSPTAPTAGTLETNTLPCNGTEDICNNVSVTAAQTDPNTANNSADEPTNVVAVASVCDLSMTKTHSAGPYATGATITYNLTLSNAGPNATGSATTTFVDKLPTGVTYVSSSFTGGGSCGTPDASNTIICSFNGNVPSGGTRTGSITVTVNATAPTAGSLNSGSCTGSEDLCNTILSMGSTGCRDTNQANNTVSVAADVLRPVSNLGVTKTDSPDSVAQGDTLTYTLNVTNAGPAAATNVDVVDTLPANVTYVSSTASGGCTLVGLALTCRVSDIANGGSTSFTITTRVNSTATTTTTAGSGAVTGACTTSSADLCNSATVSSYNTDPTPANNTATQPTNVIATVADLSLTKTDSSDPLLEGGVLVYTLTASNLGTGTARNVTVVDTLGAGEYFLETTASGGCVESPAGTLTCSLADIANLGSTSFTITVFVPTGAPTAGTVQNDPCTGSPTTDICNTAVVSSSTPDPTLGNNTAVEPTNITAASADLQITKEDTGYDPVVQAATVTYTIHASNPGPNDAQDVVITDVLDPDTTYVSDTFGCDEGPTGTLVCDIGALLVGQTVDFTVTATVSMTAPTAGTLQNGACTGSEDICNNITISSSTSDPTPSNNTADEPTNVLPFGSCFSDSNCNDGLYCNGVETCVSNACVAGTNPCTGGAVCANVCNEAADNCFVTAGTVCRAAGGVCDVAETCTGSNAACPADVLLTTTTTCRTSAGVCDVAETCTGASTTCPADSFATTANTCRASAGVCDVAETCSGTAAACPADAFATTATTCRASAGVCDVAENCTGAAAACPADTLETTATTCRASAGVCDVAETCTGAAAACPADTFATTATTCRASAGVCDVAETCTGAAAACPVDAFATTATTCRASAGVCDVAETCTGAAAACPADALATTATTCRASAGVCDVAETCTGAAAACPADTFATTATTCRASAGVCDVAEACTGAAAACPADTFATTATTCRASAGVCDVAETCTGAAAACPVDAFATTATTCRASAGVCDVAETCTGAAAACPADLLVTAGTTCRASSGVCDVAETCTGAATACPADGFVSASTTCRASAGVCDVAENCTGATAACPVDGFVSAATTCRTSAGVCDVAETCTGAAAACPADAFLSAATTCRASAGVCDVDENCTGAAAACPADAFAPGGTPCNDSLFCNGVDTCSNGSCDHSGDPCTGTACNELNDTCPLLAASIGHRLWLDENGNGVQDAGEDGLAGVVVQLYDATGTILLATTITDIDGGYIFTDLPVATYVVRVDSSTLPAGLAANPTYDFDNGTTNPDGETSVTLLAGVANNSADFGYNWVPASDSSSPGPGATGAIGDRIWNDADSDGIIDFNEAGIAGVTVNLLTDDNGDGVFGGGGDNAPLTTTTGPDGSYIFDGIAPGAYVIQVDTTTLPAGYSTTPTGDPDSDGDNTSNPILLAPGDVWLAGDFGYPLPSGHTIGNTIYVDANADGTRNGGEPGIAGVTVSLLDNSGNVIASTSTDENGNYAFPGLPDGTYSVVITDTLGVLSDTPTNTGDPDGGGDRTASVVLAGADDFTQNFGFAPSGQDPGEGLIGNIIFLDRDGNGVFDDGEGLEGVTVELYDATGTTLVATVITDAYGRYIFGGLDASETYVVRVATSTLPGGGAGLVNTVDPDGSTTSEATVDLTAYAGGITFTQNFAYEATTPNTIGGTVWVDSNGNGTQDPGETAGYAGVVVVLRDSNGNVVATTTTDASGNYSFGGLPDGTYTVDVTEDGNVLGGQTKSDGPSPGTNGNSQADGYTVTVGGGVTNTTADFGYFTAGAAVGNFVFSDDNNDGIQDPGEAGLAGVVVTLTISYPNGDVTTMVTVTDSLGAYSFGNLLLDEDFDGVGAGEPVYTVSVATPGGHQPSPIGATTNPQLDSNDPSGSVATVTQGVTNTTDDSLASNGLDFGFAPLGCIVDADCDDGLFCNGVETCVANACVVGTNPCLGGNVCGNVCNETADNCFVTAGSVCRAAAGVCDVPETCTGTSTTCPADTLATAGTSCRASAGACDVAESCTGASATCPADAFAPAATPCGSSSDTVCDNPDSCNGSGTCLANSEPVTTSCRGLANACDIEEFCDGAGSCPVDSVNPSCTADLSITKSDPGSSVNRGENFTYSILVTNSGPSDATNVRVVDTLDVSTSYVSDTGGCVQAPAGILTCPIGNLANGASTSFTVTVNVFASAPFTDSRENGTCNGSEDLCNRVTVSASEGDPVPADNTDSEPTDVAAVDLAVDKSDSGAGVNRLEEFAYTVVVTNNGPGTATNVVAVDTLDTDTTYVADTGGCSQGPVGRLTCPVGTLLDGESETFTVTVRANATAPTSGQRENGTCNGAQDLCNTVVVSAAQSDATPGNNTDREPTNVLAASGSADLAITKTDVSGPVQQGGFSTYEMIVTNNGISDADGVHVVDTLDPSMTYVTSSVPCTLTPQGLLGCSLGSIASGASSTFTVVVHVDAAAPTASSLTGPACPGTEDMCNRASVSSLQSDSNAANNTAVVATNVLPTTLVSELSLTKNDIAAEPVLPGSNVTYQVVVANAGPNMAANVVIHDTLDPYMTYVSDDAGCTVTAGGTTAGASLLCPMGNVNAGSTATLNVVVTIALDAPVDSTNQDGDCADTEDVCNTAMVTTSSADFNIVNNADSEPTDVSLLLTCGDGNVDPGEECDPPNGEVCNNGIDDDGNGTVDCADPSCQAPGFQSCNGNCLLTPQCLPILDDPARINWDSVNLHGKFIPLTPADPSTDGFRFVLSNANGEFFTAEMLPGDMTPRVRKLSKWTYKNRDAKLTREGIYRVGVHQRLEKTGEISYVFTIQAYGDMSNAVLATMTSQVYIGDDIAYLSATWLGKTGAWKLDKKTAYATTP